MQVSTDELLPKKCCVLFGTFPVIAIMTDVCVMSEENNLTDQEIFPETADCPEEAFGFGDDLELNQFDGLPFSSRYYTLLKERKALPVWKIRCEFVDTLVNNQLVIVSGTAKTGKSTQVSLSDQ